MMAGMMTPASTRDRLIMAAILLLALALRLPVMNAPLWYDEIITVETHLKLNWGGMLTDYSMNHHYLHNLLAKATMGLFGPEPWAIRLPALLFGLGSIWAVWALARRVSNMCIAHATALMMALSYHEIWFSTNARGYTGMAFFSLLALILFLDGLKDGRTRTWVGFALTLAAIIFTHLTGAFFVVALGLCWLIMVAHGWRRDELTRDLGLKPFLAFLGGGLLTILVYLPLIPSLRKTIGGVAGTSAVDPMKEYQNPIWTAAEGLRTGVGGAGTVMVIAGLAVLVTTAFGIWALRHRGRLVARVMFLHIVLTVGALTLVGMRIWPRFFFTDIALILLLITAGVAQICTLLGRLTVPRVGAALFPVAVLLMALVSAKLAVRNYEAPKQDMAGAFAFAEAHRTPGTRVYAFAYYSDAFTWHFGADWDRISTAADYDKAMAAPGPVEFVVAFPDRSFRSFPALDADRASGKLVETARFPGTLGDGDIFILARPDAASTGASGG